MKRIFIVIATITILTSCSQTELEQSFVGQKEIKFSNLNDKVSRAANDDNANYKVCAAWSGGANWFINDEVDGTSNVSQNGPYYWPATGTVDFYAWAPATVTATGIYPTLSITYAVPANADEDFTIATPKTGLSSGTVDFVFSHMLAKISVTASLDQDLMDSDHVLDITGLVGKLSVQSTGGTINPTITTPDWTSPNAASLAYSGAASYMIMPQSSVGCKIQITGGILISKNGVEIYRGDLKEYVIVAGNVTSDKFEKGKHYMLNLTISDASSGGGGENIFKIINFTSDVVSWDPETVPLPQP